MIKLAFMTLGRKVIKFTINGKIVNYSDEIWGNLQLYPLDKELVKRLATSPKLNLRAMADLIVGANSGEDLKQYLACNSEEEIAGIIRKDCKSKGLIEVK